MNLYTQVLCSAKSMPNFNQFRTVVIIPHFESVLDCVCGLAVRVRDYRSRDPGDCFPALQDFLRSSGSGTGSTQPLEYNLGAI
jgi:hypothetical protein